LGTGGGIVLLKGSSFHEGTIEVDVAGQPQANAPALARGEGPLYLAFALVVAVVLLLLRFPPKK
jgi:hypothetical protein